MRNMFNLAGKTSVVTGGGRGIGRGIAKSLAQNGSAVVVSGRSADALRNTVDELRAAGAEAEFLVQDITEPSASQDLANFTLQRFGAIDCWVNNAGSASPDDVGPLLDIDEGRWDRVVDLNLKATFFACQTAARVMTSGGSLVNITSRSASQPNPNTGHYGAAKSAVENLSATMAVEWGHLGIRVNCVAPGLVLTELDETDVGVMNTPERRQRQIDSVPLGRLGVVDDIGPVVAFLASDETAWLSGAVIPVNGGSRVSVGYMSYLRRVAAQKRSETSS
ncbi:SDR family NAD(P)-dependent oxidoreductase [Aeromicrobium wangtongii]|uniref:Glucose 1-dehydrogenase n=1 Tax=Aeromicrobium wangtongii TaxID=2969247 RepID=A0ABY5MF43_9ACTN|nr:glucose 1-dehydrogenase [Aeromicrobium wangtongii]MCD9196950.1 glucose 1-dehydrogenase [Aeromicrobium wangtongii]UUP14456.1 glucose 1-dehydrogenase [Aeromicrobium wangtongii]